MDATRTTVAHTVTVANSMPLAAISAHAKVPPLCVTVIGACASCKVAALATLCPTSNADGAVVGHLDSEDATYTVTLSAVSVLSVTGGNYAQTINKQS